MSYSGSIENDQNIQNEIPTSGSTPNDDVTGTSSQDGNPPNDSRSSTPPEPVSIYIYLYLLKLIKIKINDNNFNFNIKNTF